MSIQSPAAARPNVTPLDIASLGPDRLEIDHAEAVDDQLDRPDVDNPDMHPADITWEALPADYILPDDPVENIQQPALAAGLTDALGANGRLRPEMLLGTNFGLVAKVKHKTVVKAPDWFYIPRVNPLPEGIVRRSYTSKLDGDRVAIVMEFLSDGDNGELSVRSTYPYGKFYFYEKILKVPTYVTYDPYEAELEVRCLKKGGYHSQQPNSEGRFWIPELSLWLGLWSGVRLGGALSTSTWLRWWDESGNMLLWSEEQVRLEQEQVLMAREQAAIAQEQVAIAQEQASIAQERADLLAAKLRELGIDPEALGAG
jgi:Uma2 family endonuclease